MAEREPLAFMSYLRKVDEHDSGRLTELRKRLEGEVQIYTGEDFAIFQDREDIAWGQQWRRRIEESLDDVTFLIPIITPGFFNSAPCREELELFLKREKALDRSDLILPIYYIDYPAFNNEYRRRQDSLMAEMAKRQYEDWRELRHEALTSAAVGRKLARLAEVLRDALSLRRPMVTIPSSRPSEIAQLGHEQSKAQSQRIFLSYSREDEEFVDRLVSDLRSYGVDVWRDVEQIEPGQRWSDAIKQALSETDTLIYVASLNSSRSRWVQNEVMYFAQKQFTTTIPLIIDDEGAENLPDFIAQFHWIDFRSNYETALGKLLDALPRHQLHRARVDDRSKVSKGYLFLSYAEEDEDFVDSLRKFLSTHGYGYWDFSKGERNYHAQFANELEGRIREAAATVCIVSPYWKRSRWTTREYFFSEEVDKPIFLLKVKEVEPTLAIAGFPFIDFTRDIEHGFARLEQELRRKGL